jgi:hypothetical protein
MTKVAGFLFLIEDAIMAIGIMLKGISRVTMRIAPLFFLTND